jgi:Zn-dependent alcohol dehydrogenase
LRAAVCRSFGAPLELEYLEIRPPAEGEVGVRVSACAVCQSDVAYIDGAWEGELPAVYGHEAAGVVEALGPGSDGLAVGDHVAVTLVSSCGICPSCQHDRPALCEGPRPDGWGVLWRDDGQAVYRAMNTGAFAERVVVQSSQVVRLPPSIRKEAACLLACGVLTGVGAVVNTARVEPGSSVVVLGAGGVGLNVVQGARLAGAEPIVAADLVAAKLEVARRLGATDVVDAASGDLEQSVRRATAGRGADHVFVAAGLARLVETGSRLLAKGGTLVLVGIPPNGARISLDPVDIADRSLKVLGCKMGGSRPAEDIPRLAELYLGGQLKLDELVSGLFSFESVNEAIASARRGEQLRPVLVMS